MKRSLMILLCLCALLSVQAQDITNGSKWWSGADLYTATVRAGGVVYFQGSDYNELTIEKVGDKAGTYKIIPSRQAEDKPPLRGEFGWRVQHIRQEGMNFLVVRRPNGDASEILVLTPDNLKNCKGQEEWAEKQPVSDIITGMLLNTTYLSRFSKDELRLMRNEILARHGWKFQSKDLQGKAAVFKCRVNSIQVKELPELNDDFAQDVSEFDTLDEYRASVEAKIRERKEKDAQNQKETAAVEKAVANAAVEIPDAMVEDQAQRMVDEFAQQLQSQGLTIDQYRQYTGMNESAFLDQMKPQAIARIRSSLVLEAIAKAEQIEISDERLDEEIQKMADQYRMEKEKFYELLSDESKAQMKEDIAVQEAVKLIGGSAVEVDMPEEETEPADLEETPDAE